VAKAWQLKINQVAKRAISKLGTAYQPENRTLRRMLHQLRGGESMKAGSGIWSC